VFLVSGVAEGADFAKGEVNPYAATYASVAQPTNPMVILSNCLIMPMRRTRGSSIAKL